MKTQNILLAVMICCTCMTACYQAKTETTTATAVPATAEIHITPTAVPISRTGWGPAPLRPHFTERNSNRNVKLRTQTPYPPGTTPAHQRDVVTITDAAMNGTAGVKSVFIPTSSVPPEPAVQPIIVKPYMGW